MKQVLKSGVAAALLCGALVSGPVSAAQDEQFSALGNVEAQALSMQEMDAIHGALTATEVKDAYFAKLDALVAKYPTLAASVDRLKASFLTRLYPLLVKLLGV